MYEFIVVEFQPGGVHILKQPRTWRAVAAEFIATFLFVFVCSGSVVSSASVFHGVAGPIAGLQLLAIAASSTLLPSGKVLHGSNGAACASCLNL
eukprot:SM004806S16623  [mRNA]  locus=s4806:377:759:- [translate_table: standard]